MVNAMQLSVSKYYNPAISIAGMCPGLEEWWTGDVVYYVHLHTLEMILYCLVTISGGHFKLSGGYFI